MKALKLSFVFAWFCKLIFALFFCVSCSEADYSVVDIAAKYDENINKESSYFVVFGDIQNYTKDAHMLEYYIRSCSWIREQIDAYIDVSTVLQVGDITDNNKPFEWEYFRQTSVTISSITPYFVCTGNHDYEWHSSSKIHDRSSSLINDYSHFPLADRKIVQYYVEDDLSNYVALLNENHNLYLMALEFGPREEVIEWALKITRSRTRENDSY